MATTKKTTAKKAAPKKMVKRPAPKKQVQKEELAPVPTQQNPQPPMGTPPMGGNGPMMKRGGKIKKAANGVVMTTTTDKTTKKSSYETSPVTKAKQDKQNKEDKYKNLGGEIGRPTGPKGNRIAPTSGGAKNGKTMKKAQGGTKFGMASVKAGYDDNPNATAADRIVLAKKNAGTAKSGAKMKMGGKMAKQAAVAIAMKKAGKTPKKMQYGGKAASMAPMKNGGKMAKCKYGCN